MGIAAHPYADLFPLLTGRQLDELGNDIALNGLVEPITLLDGMVLDGRNRLAACTNVGVVPRFVDFNGNEPLRFVISKNLVRRHLKESQRALIAARMATAGQGRRKLNTGMTQTEVAQVLRVSVRSIGTAQALLKSGRSDLIDAVESAKISLNAAMHSIPAKVMKTGNSRRSATIGRSGYRSIWLGLDGVISAMDGGDVVAALLAARHLVKTLESAVGGAE